jgi:hypothetical protein
MALNFAERGFKNTSKWITFSLEKKMSPFLDDIQDIVNSIRIEFRSYRQEFYNDPQFNDDCFETIFSIIVGGMSVGREEFQGLTFRLAPLIDRIFETSKGMNILLKDAKNLELNEKFQRYCHYYQMMWESDYKFFRRNLLAMKRLRAGKKIAITETLAIASDEKAIESDASLEEVIPKRLKTGDHTHLRNSIAHCNFKFIKQDEKMEFWDINPKTQKYSWEPKKYSLEEFSMRLIEIDLFCEAFVFSVLLLMALSDLNKP